MVVWTEPAKSDLQAIYNFIGQSSKYYARKVIEEIVERSVLLVTNPRLGRIVPEFQDPKVRELMVYSYRLIYEIASEANCVILTVAHARQNLGP